MNIKLLSRWFSSILLLATMFAGNLLSVKAQTSAGDDVVSLQTMGQQDTILAGPLDSRSIFFRLPADWSMLADSTLHVNLNAATGISSDSNSSVAGFFEVYLNDSWLTTINITKDGEHSFDIAIPTDAWLTAAGATQRLRFILVDALRCEMWLSAASAGGNVRAFSTVLRSSSYIEFKYNSVPVPTDLKLFPYPFFQRSFIPDNVVIVAPDHATQGEMEAAMTTSAALGRLTDGKLKMSLITASQLDDAMVNDSNLIFIGKPVNFPQLTSANLPAPYDNVVFQNVKMGTDDGILQMVTTPQNPSKVWLLVSGNNDAGIIKAAQAVGSNQIQPYGAENVAVISSITTNDQNSNQTDFTFSDLGYPFEQTYTGAYNDLGIWFDMPANLSAADGAYFEMVFTNSALLDFDSSGVKVNVNNHLIGGLRFSDRSTSVTHWKFNIPANLLLPGRNLLLLQLSITGSSPCVADDDLWFSIMPESLLHLPTSVNSASSPKPDLSRYPNSMFSTFNQTVFVLPDNDSFAWSVASKLAFDLGRKLGGPRINVPTYYAGAVPDEILRSKDLILVGRPSTLPLLEQLSQVMPAPFERGQDIAQVKDAQYSFTVTNNVPVGYVQIFSSPWDSKFSILTVSGNMNQSLDAAATALITPSIQKQMVGNFIAVLNSKIIVQRIETTATSQTSPQVVLPADQQSNDSVGKSVTTGKFNISLPFIVLIVVIILVAIGVAVLFIHNEDSHGEGKNKR